MITDLLLYVNIVVDIIAEREPYAGAAIAAFEHAQNRDHRVWLYTGSVQTLEYVTANELRRMATENARTLGIKEAHEIAKRLIRAFSRHTQWLAALSQDGDVWESEDSEDAQLKKAVVRLGEGGVLLTRDEQLLNECGQAITVNDYVATSKGEKTISFIDLAAQQDAIRPLLEHRIHHVLRHGHYIMGPEIGELEERLADFAAVKHAIACSSGTDALFMALIAYEVGPGDAVFTTPFTFIATAEVITLLGATPIFVDIDPRTFNIDPGKLELAVQALNEGTPELYPLPRAANHEPSALNPRGIIPADLFGLPSDYDSIMAIADKYGLFVLEDAAQSFGASYKGRRAGSMGHVAATSFFPAKPLGCYGDGGAVLTDDEELAEALRSIRVHGKGGHKYDNVRIGLNARLDTLQAAILLPKLEQFPWELEARQRVATKYSELLSPFSIELLTPHIPSGLRSAWAQYSLLTERRAEIQRALKDKDIHTAVYYPKPLHLQTAFGFLGYREEDMPVSEDCSRRIFSLPMHPYLRQEEINHICNVIAQILK